MSIITQHSPCQLWDFGIGSRVALRFFDTFTYHATLTFRSKYNLMNTRSNENSMKSLARRIQRTAEKYTYERLQQAGLKLAEALPVKGDDVIPFNIIPDGQTLTFYTMKVWTSIQDEKPALNVKVSYPNGEIDYKEKTVVLVDDIPLTIIDQAISDIQNHITK